MNPVSTDQSTPIFLELHGDTARTYSFQDENMRVLAKEILPMAILNVRASLKGFECNGIKLTVLNYTPYKICFDENRRLSIENCHISNFSKDDCQVIAYQVNGSPEVICLENKDILKPNPSKRFFAEIESKNVIERSNWSDGTYRDIRLASGNLAIRERMNLKKARYLFSNGYLNDKQSSLSCLTKDFVSLIFSNFDRYVEYLDIHLPMDEFIMRAD